MPTKLIFACFIVTELHGHSWLEMELPEIERDCIQLSEKVSVERKTGSMRRLTPDVCQLAKLVRHSDCRLMLHVNGRGAPSRHFSVAFLNKVVKPHNGPSAILV